jgi:tetratricopeptide (TPR) repeat protein
MTIQQALESAGVHHQAGRLREAEAVYLQILSTDPNNAHALGQLALLACQAKRFDAAVELFGRVVALQPNSADALTNLGNALVDVGNVAHAIPILRQAAKLAPQSPVIQYNLGNALQKQGTAEESIEHYRSSLALRPGDVPTINQLGNALKTIGRLDEAVVCFHQALSNAPWHAWSHNNLADALRCQGKLPEALASIRRALELAPEFPTFHWNLGIIALMLGQFTEGWKEYAWRSRVKEITFLRKDFSQPMWDGEELTGKTILIHAEQGFGDSIQFVRYLPMVKARGGRILVECAPELIDLFCGQFEVDQWLTDSSQSQFDLHCPLLNLPLIFNTTLETIPGKVPYLSALPKSAAKWGARLPGDKRLKVGLVWAGKPNHANDRNRSLPLSALLPVFNVLNTLFVSLQKDPPADEVRHLPSGIEFIDWRAELNDFAQTAALLSNLDLVMSVDTAVAHLAGAMGKPVWVLLPFAPDWRWMLNRADSPWYPTMRLFRQRAVGDWDDVVRRVAQSLQDLTCERGSR